MRKSKGDDGIAKLHLAVLGVVKEEIDAHQRQALKSGDQKSFIALGNILYALYLIEDGRWNEALVLWKRYGEGVKKWLTKIKAKETQKDRLDRLFGG